MEICAGVSLIAFAGCVYYVFHMIAEEYKSNETND